MSRYIKLLLILLIFIVSSCITTPQEDKDNHTFREIEYRPLDGNLKGCVFIGLERSEYPRSVYVIRCPQIITAHYNCGKNCERDAIVMD